jgi:hypothetical protein
MSFELVLQWLIASSQRDSANDWTLFSRHSMAEIGFIVSVQGIRVASRFTLLNEIKD